LKVRYGLILAGLAALLVYAVNQLPGRGDPDAPAHRERALSGAPGAAHYYLKNALADAETPNAVTVILADYRGFDTLGETLVVFTGGIACLLILRGKR
jgi:multicomponent Na+:H+ antiporter subunit B